MFFVPFLFIFLSIFSNTIHGTSFKKIVLVAGGQGPMVSRTIGDYYENSITVGLCTALAVSIETACTEKNIRCSVLTIKPSPHLFSPNNTELAEKINKADADLVIHIGLYMQPEETPSVHFFYYHSTNNQAIPFQHASDTPAWIKAEHAHLKNSTKSKKAALSAEKIIQKNAAKGLYINFPPKGLPFLPLKGIIAPAFACEIGIEKPYDWKSSLKDISNACIHCFLDE